MREATPHLTQRGCLLLGILLGCQSPTEPAPAQPSRPKPAAEKQGIDPAPMSPSAPPSTSSGVGSTSLDVDVDPQPKPEVSPESPPPAKRSVYGFVYKSKVTHANVLKGIQSGGLSTVAVHMLHPNKECSLDTPGVVKSAVVVLKTAVAQARPKGVSVDVNVGILDSGGLTAQVLDNCQDALIDAIMEVVVASDVDGVCLDFEKIPAEEKYAKAFAAFAAALRSRLAETHRSLTVAVGNDIGKNDHAPGLGEGADRIFIMAYVYHYSGSKYAGPQAPLRSEGVWWSSYMDRIFHSGQKAWKSQVAPEKLILGAPFYGSRWQVTESRIKAPAVKGTYKALSHQGIVKSYGSLPELWDPASETPYFESVSGDVITQVWSESRESYLRKLRMAESHGFGGVGMWTADYLADEEIWELLRLYREGALP